MKVYADYALDYTHYAVAVKLRQRRLSWFGQVNRAEGSLLKEVEDLKIGGRRPVGNPKKKWRVIEDMNTLGIEEHMAQDWQLWKAAITDLTPL